MNISLWLQQSHNSGWFTGVLNVALPVLFGADYMQSTVPLVDVLMLTIGICVLMFIALLLFVMSFTAYVVLK